MRVVYILYIVTALLRYLRRTAEPQNRRTAEPQNRRTAEPQNRRTAEPEDDPKLQLLIYSNIY